MVPHQVLNRQRLVAYSAAHRTRRTQQGEACSGTLSKIQLQPVVFLATRQARRRVQAVDYSEVLQIPALAPQVRLLLCIQRVRLKCIRRNHTKSLWKHCSEQRPFDVRSNPAAEAGWFAVWCTRIPAFRGRSIWSASSTTTESARN